MKKIAIIGCGISGLYFANQLQNKKIYDYTIYEKKSELDLNDGYGIQLSVNSIKLLNEIGFKNIAAKIYNFIKRNKNQILKKEIKIENVKKIIKEHGARKIDYIKIFDINKIIKPFKKIKRNKIFIAYYLRSTRLIDNI